MGVMNKFAPLFLSLAVSLAPALPATAQEGEAEAEVDEGLNLLQEGANLLLRGLIQEIEPKMREFGNLADDLVREIEPSLRALSDEMGPALADLLGRIDSITHYSPPEILENGDIIIRRKDDAPPYVAPERPEPDAPQIDL
jgi:hypothetical protein